MKTKTKQPECPECEKLVDVSKESQPIGEFIEWLKRKYDICELVESEDMYGGEYVPVYKTTNQLLADYFQIDLDKVEHERRALLDWLREQHETEQN